MEQEFLAYGPWFFLIYLVIRDIVPKLFPDILSALNKRTSTEDRLFTVLDSNAKSQQELIKTLADLETAIQILGETLIRLDTRVGKLEDKHNAFMIAWVQSLPEHRAELAIKTINA